MAPTGLLAVNGHFPPHCMLCMAWQVLSNVTYRSVEHRVVASAAAERISVAFFYNPRSDLPVGPAGELVAADRPPLYQPMTFDEYRLYVRTKGPRGKSQLMESLKSHALPRCV